MQFQIHQNDGACQPPPRYSNPRVVVQEHQGAPLLNWSGLVLVRELIERLGIVSAIDRGLRLLRRCKWYRESDHILTLIYNILGGGNTLQDCARLRQDEALKRVLGSDRIPHATTLGKFLWRFGDRKRDRHGLALKELRETTEAVQQDAFALLPRERRRVATQDWDSSIHEVYGNKKEGADWAYNNTWSYNGLYGTLAETGDLLYLGLREGYRHTSYGMKEVLPGTIERVGKHFREQRLRADSGYYSQALVRICEEREVEYFIVAKQHRNLMNAVREIAESQWRQLDPEALQEGGGSRRRRKRRRNLKREIMLRRKPNSRFKGAPEVATMMFQPKSWKKARRYVIKRTPIIDKDDQQLCLDDGLRRYVYWIVVTNSKRSNAAGVAHRAGARQPGEPDKGLQVRVGTGACTDRFAGGESSLLHDRGAGLESEDLDAEPAAAWGWRGDALPALSVSVAMASRSGGQDRPQHDPAQAAGG